MSFSPVVPLGGLAGWSFLKRTGAAQQAAYAASPATARETERFAERIGEIGSAAELVEDRALLKVALGAFGLGADLDNRHFVRRILEEGVTERGALANKLTDKRYAELARAFATAFEGPQAGVVEGLVEGYRSRSLDEFVAARDGDHDRRLGLIVKRELTAPFDPDVTENTRWNAWLTSPATSEVLRRGLGLPESVSGLGLAERRDALREAAQARFGEGAIDRLSEPKVIDGLLKGFFSSLAPPPDRSGLAARIVAAYEARGFEEAVGEQQPAMRLALNLERELPKLATRDGASDTTLWFTIMGTPPLREVFETAFGLPKSFGTLDVDQQLGILRDKARSAFGDEGVAQFANPGTREELTRLFLARSQLTEGFGPDYSPAGTALALLTGAAG